MKVDPIAESVGLAIAAANRIAAASGVDPARSHLTITDDDVETDDVWHIEYGARDFVHRRGGDLIVLVDKASGEVQRVLHGQ